MCVRVCVRLCECWSCYRYALILLTCKFNRVNPTNWSDQCETQISTQNYHESARQSRLLEEIDRWIVRQKQIDASSSH